MAKRYQPLKEFGRSMKKPKLEVSINRGPSTSKAAAAAAAEAAAAAAAAQSDLHIRPTQKEPFKPSTNLWDDDDEDDVLLLATQIAESEVAASKAKNENFPMEITDSEITFSDFEPKIKRHSTQQQQPVNDLLSQMFDEDDDDIATLAAAIENEAKTKHLASEEFFREENVMNLFKIPAVPVKETLKKVSSVSEEAGPSAKQEAEPSIAAKKQLASEKQIQFLMERMDALKEENKRLNTNLSEIKENMQTKTGETILLRSELRHTKQKLDELKMEKVFQTETVNVECKNKIEELSKQVQDKESQLQLKSMECSVLKMRHADETKRLDTTARDTTNMETDDKSSSSTNDIPMEMFDFHIADPPLRIESTSTEITTEIFEKEEEKYNFGKWNAVQKRELDNLQGILAKVQLNPLKIRHEIIDEINTSVRNIFLEFKTYVKSLDFGYHETVLSQHEYDVLEEEGIRPVGCLHLTGAIVEGERGVKMRRYIAILAVICEKSSHVTHALLAEVYEEKPLLQLAIDAIIILGVSLEVCPHFTILESFAILLRSMLLHLKENTESDHQFVELLIELLKQILFTRPNPWILFELSFSVLDMYERFPLLLEHFCVNSSRETFQIDRAKSVYRFSNDSCLMQVYCGLLEAAFPLYIPLKEPLFELQTKLCLNHVRFVYYCLTDPPEFIDKFLYDDEEDEDVSKSDTETSSTRQFEASKKPYETFEDEQPTTSKNATASSNGDTLRQNVTDKPTADASKASSKCQCFEMLCLSSIRIVWLSLRQWIRYEKIIETEQVGLISRVAVLLFHFIFCANYLSCLFREEEEDTKHFMYLICDWWMENEKKLEFQEIHSNLLKKIKNSHVIPKLFCEEEAKLENITADFEEWCRLTNEPFDPKTIDPEQAIKDLRLEEDMMDPEKFREFLEEPCLDMKSFEFDW